MKKLSVIICFMTMGALAFSGCKKKDGGEDDGNGINTKTYSFKITSSNIQAQDEIRLSFIGVAADGNGTAKTVFKIDGVPQENQQTIDLTKAQITKAGGVTVESVGALYECGFSLGGFSATTGHTFIVKVVPTVNAKAETTVTKTFTTDVFSQTYKY